MAEAFIKGALMNKKQQHRYFLKDAIRKTIDFRGTDQNRGIPEPPLEKPCPPKAVTVRLPDFAQWSGTIAKTDLVTAMAGRKSRRRFQAMDLTIDELAFLLWATQGVRDPNGKQPYYRTVPSAGARHSFETYLFVFQVEGLEEGLYRFLPIENELLFLGEIDDMARDLTNACFGQAFASKAAATFVWTTIAYRMEWRYDLAAHRVILMDVGHVCQNLYLACEAIDCGTCAIGAYDQEALDQLLGVDGEEEFAIYMAPVGKKL